MTCLCRVWRPPTVPVHITHLWWASVTPDLKVQVEQWKRPDDHAGCDHHYHCIQCTLEQAIASHQWQYVLPQPFFSKDKSEAIRIATDLLQQATNLTLSIEEPEDVKPKDRFTVIDLD